ncbi:hypothetical protein ENSA7_12070 [Enhygromyxa salina]|uniref:Uncharacterized protein n=1 Tax=Enhygromyxa salina TaxID=215803 RepID=A0A2S9YVU4_9BACT|nr:hypothetical protein ENSA7_12070 [Enhygromyxa salina]
MAGGAHRLSAPRLPPDFANLFVCLNEAGAEYMLVGGYAVMIYGYLRTTQALDVWVHATPGNAARVMQAMTEFGLPPGLSLDVLGQIDGSPPTGFRFGRSPFAVDLLTSVRGVSFNEAWPESVVRSFDGVSVRVISRRALLQNKRSTGRPKDAADVEALERLGDLST